MRIILSVMALVLAVGLALPGESDARAPRKAQRWGCSFRAWGINAEGLGSPVIWYGGGDVYRCDRAQRLVIKLAIVEHIPAAPNRVWSRRWLERRHPAGLGGIRYLVDGGECPMDGSAPTAYPVYLRMQVKRPGRPGIVRVASRDVENICAHLAPAHRPGWPGDQPSVPAGPTRH